MKNSIIIFSLLFSFFAQAQDIITLRDGKEIKSKVTEVGTDEIKYKKFENLEGPTYSLKKEDVFTITYENGTKDVLNPQSTASYVETDREKKKESQIKYRSSISINLGHSSAIGSFGSQSTSQTDAGFAQSGANLFLDFSFRFKEEIGAMIKWYGNANSFNSTPLVNNLRTSTGFDWIGDNSYFYSTGGFLIGPTFHIPIVSQKFYIDFRLLGGYNWITTPEYRAIISGRPDIWIRQEAVTDNSFGYNIGTGFTVFIFPRASLRMNIDYQGANYSFNAVPSRSSWGTSNLTSFNTPWRVFNIGAGFGFHF